MTGRNFDCPTYRVLVKTKESAPINGIVGPISKERLPTDWDFEWPYIWDRTDFSGQAIIALSVEGAVWGVVKFGLYPCGDTDISPEVMVVEQLEAHPSRNKNRSPFLSKPPPSPEPYIDPVGRWLMWYACQIALDNCQPEEEKPLIVLDAAFDAVDYYIDIIGMKMTDDSVSSSGEDSYGFSFDTDEAEDFWAMQHVSFGKPQRISEKYAESDPKEKHQSG